MMKFYINITNEGTSGKSMAIPILLCKELVVLFSNGNGRSAHFHIFKYFEHITPLPEFAFEFWL
jgi:hypothetical protein